MINYLRHMAVFTKVVDEQSFRAAAKSLGLAPSRVSETISDLEKFLGVTLFYRTTRKLSLTTEGSKFYEHAAQVTRHAEAGINELNATSQKPAGSLKVSLPAFLTHSTITNAIVEFAKLYPEVSLSLFYTDQVMDIVKEGLDLSIRVGWPKDSSMMSRKLGESKRMLVAGKQYAKQFAQVQHPTDLKDADWVRFQMRNNTIDFTSKAGEAVSISEHSRISANSAEALLNLALQNLGLTILPEHAIKSHLETGELVQILPQWDLKPLGYYAIWPDQSRRENLTLMLVRFIAGRSE
ncbi:LysR family transcriptional regulator [Marinicellulosiphila megalodicopiae]|uniref:LysR family transcriptional regulator n=1 Tax=Marinicellulosiphila megalodicopiae TaxID=2724896 RepID=UPI003BB10E32